MNLLIRQYKNRKYYNTETNSYVTGAAITKLLKDREITIINHATKMDITQQQLMRILGSELNRRAETIENKFNVIEYLKRAL